MPPTDCLRCLTIDLSRAPEPVRTAVAQHTDASDELRDLLCEAGRASLPLLILSSHGALTLVSTSQHHLRAFRPVLAMIREGLLGIAGWRNLPVQIASGSDAARQLLGQTLRDARCAPDSPDFMGNLRRTAELSRACGASSAELSALVRMAEHTRSRIEDETRWGRPGASAAELELESMVAERIVEEELVAWQSFAPALRATRRPVSDADIGSFSGEERHSAVRIRPVLAKLRTA